MNQNDMHLMAELGQLEEQITELREQNRHLQKKLANVALLVENWKHYCLTNGGQTMRLMAEVDDVLNGVPVIAGTDLIQ